MLITNVSLPWRFFASLYTYIGYIILNKWPTLIYIVCYKILVSCIRKHTEHKHEHPNQDTPCVSLKAKIQTRDRWQNSEFLWPLLQPVVVQSGLWIATKYFKALHSNKQTSSTKKKLWLIDLACNTQTPFSM